MAKKQAVKKTAAKKPAKKWMLPLVLDDKAQKQLKIAQEITGEKTATKAIIQSMFLADHYLKESKVQKERADGLEMTLNENRRVISGYLHSLKALHEVNDTKKEQPGKKTGKQTKQLSVEVCEDCGHPLDTFGGCPECDG